MTESLLTCSKKLKSAYNPHQYPQEQVILLLASKGQWQRNTRWGADRNQELYFEQTDCYPREDLEKTEGRRLELKQGG